MKTKYNKYIYQKGQTLLFVIVSVTIALAVGIAVSTRTLSSLRRSARSDTSARVIAAAEAGIENLLSKPDNLLIAASSPSESSCEGIGATYDNDLKSCVYILSKGIDNTPTLPEEPDPTCECTWEKVSCGKLGCKDTEMAYVNKCTPTGCGEYETKCESSGECGDPTIDPVDPPSDVLGDSDQAGDKISSRAVISISTFSTDENSNGYSFNLSPGDVKEIFLDGYSPDIITICFDNPNTAIYYYSYNSSGETLKSGVYPKTSSFNFGDHLKRFQESDGSQHGYNYCIKNTKLIKNKYGLRLKALYEGSKVAVFPPGSSQHLPTQGFLLVSRGELFTDKGSEEVATVKVRKSYSYVSDIFDYGVYSPSNLSGIGDD